MQGMVWGEPDLALLSAVSIVHKHESFPVSVGLAPIMHVTIIMLSRFLLKYPTFLRVVSLFLMLGGWDVWLGEITERAVLPTIE